MNWLTAGIDINEATDEYVRSIVLTSYKDALFNDLASTLGIPKSCVKQVLAFARNLFENGSGYLTLESFRLSKNVIGIRYRIGNTGGNIKLDLPASWGPKDIEVEI